MTPVRGRGPPGGVVDQKGTVEQFCLRGRNTRAVHLRLMSKIRCPVYIPGKEKKMDTVYAYC
jgi:hypothetical protein